MPSTKLIKPKPVESTKTNLEKNKSVRSKVPNGTESELKVPAVRKSRASSCPRCPQQRGRCDRTSTGVRDSPAKPSERKARSTSTAPKHTEKIPKNNTDHRRATSSVRQADANQKCRDATACVGQRGPRAEAKHAEQSNKAFTVIPPNPKKRREIQRKAEAELVALEELRLSRAMTYVSINPSSVGGCMSLEEVRLKQQQEMLLTKRKQKQVKKQVREETAVLTS
ncbi:uncharacterized protein zgc:194621 isoform X2 [Melanotaenia boesemani]|uniref:uncharacterized protein zgc:194621 isoform X2 n=1 Tax=Melanotaenia boesemani TaxID=1250792 RepID=UPI001C059C98|nr:uncharacterized protein zgc:194621 isoform X2 [Melanotaenia boesemani]